MTDDSKVRLRISVDEGVRNLFRADSISDGSNMSIDIEQFMIDRNRQRRANVAKEVQDRESIHSSESRD
jgi:hypothetical protein